MSNNFNLKDLGTRELVYMQDGRVTGCPVRIVATDIQYNEDGVDYPVLAAVCLGTGKGGNNETIIRYTANGIGRNNISRLAFKPIKKGYWIAVFKSGTITFSTEEVAIAYTTNKSNFLYLHHVEWEE